MLALERQKIILETLSINGIVSVCELSKKLDVVEETIRRDFEKLDKQGLLKRTHGGAVPIEGSNYELSLEKRKVTNVLEKQKISISASDFIVPGDTIFIDASTTTFFMTDKLRLIKNITVITNSIRIVEELSKASDVKVIAVGGIVSGNSSFVGSIAEKSIKENYFADKMFFSSKGINLNAGILESNENECGIKQRMIENSLKKFYLCDSSKIDRVGFVKLAPIEKIDYFITNDSIPQKYKNAFKDMDIKTVLA